MDTNQPTTYTDFDREETLKAALTKKKELEKEETKTRSEIEASILKKRAKLREKFPIGLRWLIRNPNWEKMNYDIPINGLGMGLMEYQNYWFDEPITQLARIIALCERSDGKHVKLCPEEVETLNLPAQVQAR